MTYVEVDLKVKSNNGNKTTVTIKGLKHICVDFINAFVKMDWG